MQHSSWSQKCLQIYSHTHTNLYLCFKCNTYAYSFFSFSSTSLRRSTALIPFHARYLSERTESSRTRNDGNAFRHVVHIRVEVLIHTISLSQLMERPVPTYTLGQCLYNMYILTSYKYMYPYVYTCVYYIYICMYLRRERYVLSDARFYSPSHLNKKY